MASKLTKTQRDEALAVLGETGWQPVEGRDAINKSYKFKSFVEAFGWMTKAAFWAEKLNHHPEWFNVYNRVDVTLTTHDCDGLSLLDVELATRLDKLANS